MDKTLLVGYIGEFGWAMIYQALFRALSRKFDRTIVVARPLEEGLYSDFCTQYIPYTPSTNLTNYATCKDDMPEGFYDKFKYDHIIPAGTNLVHWSPTKGLFHYNDRYLLGCRPEWKKFGQPAKELEYDLLIHARHTNKLGSGKRNWGVNNWTKLVQNLKGLKMACIGSMDASLDLDGADDMRGVGVNRLTNIMASSKLIVGTSSGPMHLSAHVGLRHLVITDKINHNRYHSHFNPLNTPCVTIEKYSWHPPVEMVEGMIRLILANLKTAEKH